MHSLQWVPSTNSSFLVLVPWPQDEETGWQRRQREFFDEAWAARLVELGWERFPLARLQVVR